MALFLVSWIRIFCFSGLSKKVRSGQKDPDPKHCLHVGRCKAVCGQLGWTAGPHSSQCVQQQLPLPNK